MSWGCTPEHLPYCSIPTLPGRMVSVPKYMRWCSEVMEASGVAGRPASNKTTLDTLPGHEGSVLSQHNEHAKLSRLIITHTSANGECPTIGLGVVTGRYPT